MTGKATVDYIPLDGVDERVEASHLAAYVAAKVQQAVYSLLMEQPDTDLTTLEIHGRPWAEEGVWGVRVSGYTKDAEEEA